MQGPAAGSGVDWDEVWAEYDRRVPKPADIPVCATPRQHFAPMPTPLPGRRPRRWSRPAALLAAMALCTAASAWLGASGATVWAAARAMEHRDTAALARHLDMNSVREGLRQQLLHVLSDAEHPDAAGFLQGLASDIADAWTGPDALTEVAMVRGLTAGAAADGLRAARPLGLTALELPLGTPQDGDPPVILRMELRDPGPTPRWQVTGIRLARMR